MLPQCLELSVAKGCNAMLDGGSLVLECLFPWREEEDEFGDRKSFGPVIDFVNIGEDIAPIRVEEQG